MTTKFAPTTTALERYFSPFRENTVGRGLIFQTPYGKKELIYADWTATGRAYHPIEAFIQHQILSWLGNTHTASTVTGSRMTNAYADARQIIKDHVGASESDILIFCGSGTTGAINKLQRLLGMRRPQGLMNTATPQDFLLDEQLRPVVFLSHMEHHSNQVSWLETIATVELIKPGAMGGVDIADFECQLKKYSNRKNKILSITACSNVTGIQTPYHLLAKMIHAAGGWCLVDFAAAAPYVDINMHPTEPGTHIDAIYFSPHKFLGGVGTSGVLILTDKLYANRIPDQPGGGTVSYSNPWQEHDYVANLEQREDGGTPPILQGIRAALCIKLKEQMGVDNLIKREEELLAIAFDRLSKIADLDILDGHITQRLGVISFIVPGMHYSLFIKLLNDRFGIQARGGCSCAGTYGHQLLGVSRSESYKIRNQLWLGNLLVKPGWVRISLHPTMSNPELYFIMDAIELTTRHFHTWEKEYRYQADTNEYECTRVQAEEQMPVELWFDPVSW